MASQPVIYASYFVSLHCKTYPLTWEQMSLQGKWTKEKKSKSLTQIVLFFLLFKLGNELLW